MFIIRVPLWVRPRHPHAVNDFYHENVDTEKGTMLRAVIGSLPEGTEFVSVTIQIDPSGASQRFIEYLQSSVRHAPGGRVSRKNIWAAWAERNGADPSSREIGGVYWKDVPGHFRTAFNAGDLQRKRLDGSAQRVWFDYEIESGGDDAPRAFTE